MKRSSVHLYTIVLIGILAGSGCSLSGKNLLSKSDSDVSQKHAAGADADLAVNVPGSDGESADGPPSQPGGRPKGGARKKLTGWLRRDEPKRASIPLDRTDKENDADESEADEGPSFWNHSDAPKTADASDDDLGKSGFEASNPFEP